MNARQGNYAASASDGALEEAQHNKLQMICDKLMLQEGESFLDIGCGWGTLVRHAAKHYGALLPCPTLLSCSCFALACLPGWLRDRVRWGSGGRMEVADAAWRQARGQRE